MRTHDYTLTVTWTGNRGAGTSGPDTYDRGHVIAAAGKPDLPGTMVEHPDEAGEFTEVVLHPTVTVAEPAMAARAESLHARAHAKCFIARSVAFPVHHRPTVVTA
ncbi:OsmC family protein [Rhodococcus opacus]|uniref:OsmC family protein n=1 Tax=Rhodococcus opacus TaxID=37919 RepID=UPI0002E20631|nr:OsmC family protein [Rhodococcus opacus]